MKIKLTWKKNELTPELDGIEIYRSEVHAKDLTHLSPYATIDGNLLEFVDENATQGVTYHYQVVFVKGQDRGHGPVRTIKATNYTGSGPHEILRGDDYLGLYGYMDHVDFFSTAELNALLGYNTGTIQQANPAWVKMSIKGKTLIIARNILMYNAQWVELYKAGLVYGSDDTGYLPEAFGIDPVMQDKRIEHEGAIYKVRLLEGLSSTVRDLSTLQMDDQGNLVDHADSEAALFFNAMAAATSRIHPSYKLDAWDRSDLLSSTGRTTLCQEIDLTSTSTAVKALNMNHSVTSSRSPSEVVISTTSSSYTHLGTTTYQCWRPVFELTEE